MEKHIYDERSIFKIYSQKKPGLLFGESFTLRYNKLGEIS